MIRSICPGPYARPTTSSIASIKIAEVFYCWKQSSPQRMLYRPGPSGLRSPLNSSPQQHITNTGGTHSKLLGNLNQGLSVLDVESNYFLLLVPSRCDLRPERYAALYKVAAHGLAVNAEDSSQLVMSHVPGSGPPGHRLRRAGACAP
jgi:hypothetical protein